MSYQELITSLRKDSEGKIQAIRSEADSEAATIKAETLNAINKLREEFHKEEAMLTTSRENAVIVTAENEARTMRLSAVKSLSDRLYDIATTLLLDLRADAYAGMFAACAGELPPVEWEEVRVHPDDVKIAREHFPGSRIVPDRNVTGGMEVLRDNGKQHIINTFGKRLQRAWEEILPLAVHDTYRKGNVDGNPSGHKG